MWHVYLLTSLTVVVGCSVRRSATKAVAEFAASQMPPKAAYRIRAIPQPDTSSSIEWFYTVGEDRSLTLDYQGLKVTVEYLDEDDLNAEFGPQSDIERQVQDEFSYSYFTNWSVEDPELNFVVPKMIVFRITVRNELLAKVLLDPREVRLYPDRDRREFYEIVQGATSSLGRAPGDGQEGYRGGSAGSIWNAVLYPLPPREEYVFRGEEFTGLLTFNIFDEDVEFVTLLLRRFVTRFDAYGNYLARKDFRSDSE